MLAPGFADPVRDAQAAFRAVLEAMSRPGRVHRLPAAGLRAPAPLDPAAASLVLTLADAATPVWTDAGPDAARWLAFHAGCPLAEGTGGAAFALACGLPPPLDALAQGTDEAPHLSATLLVQVEALLAGGTGGWRLRGPGIETEHRLRVFGLPEKFAAQWRANRAAFPRGVDVILCAGLDVAALPRTTAIEEG